MLIVYTLGIAAGGIAVFNGLLLLADGVEYLTRV